MVPKLEVKTFFYTVAITFPTDKNVFIAENLGRPLFDCSLISEMNEGVSENYHTFNSFPFLLLWVAFMLPLHTLTPIQNRNDDENLCCSSLSIVF